MYNEIEIFERIIYVFENTSMKETLLRVRILIKSTSLTRLLIPTLIRY